MYAVEFPAMNHWDRIYESAAYRRMIREKTVAVVAMTVFFVAYYFALPVLVGYWPDLMGRKVWGKVNWAYLFAFSQFIMTWAVAYLYMRFAGRFDRTTQGILADTARVASLVDRGGGN